MNNFFKNPNNRRSNYKENKHLKIKLRFNIYPQLKNMTVMLLFNKSSITNTRNTDFQTC